MRFKTWLSSPVLIDIVIICVTILISIVIAEGIVRVITTPPFIADSILETRLPPNKGGIDENGFRNTERPKYPGIIAIGDSQTYGTNATTNEAWPQVLGRLSGIQTYQMAVGGYGPVQYSVLFEKAMDMRPQQIMVGLYLGNDLSDAYRIAYGLDYWTDLRLPPLNRQFSARPQQTYATIFRQWRALGMKSIRGDGA